MGVRSSWHHNHVQLASQSNFPCKQRSWNQLLGMRKHLCTHKTLPTCPSTLRIQLYSPRQHYNQAHARDTLSLYSCTHSSASTLLCQLPAQLSSACTAALFAVCPTRQSSPETCLPLLQQLCQVELVYVCSNNEIVLRQATCSNTNTHQRGFVSQMQLRSAVHCMQVYLRRAHISSNLHGVCRHLCCCWLALPTLSYQLLQRGTTLCTVTPPAGSCHPAPLNLPAAIAF